MTLADLTAAREAKLHAEQTYRAAVVDAYHEHGSVPTAEAAGITRQAVQQMVRRHGDRADLDRRYTAIVEWYSRGYCAKDAAGITALRNGQAKIRAKKGLPPLETVREEALRLAERHVLATLAAGETLTIPANGSSHTTFTPADLEELTALETAQTDQDIPW